MQSFSRTLSVFLNMFSNYVYMCTFENELIKYFVRSVITKMN